MTKILTPRNYLPYLTSFPTFLLNLCKTLSCLSHLISSGFFWVIILPYFISNEFASVDYFFLRLCFNLDSLIFPNPFFYFSIILFTLSYYFLNDWLPRVQPFFIFLFCYTCLWGYHLLSSLLVDTIEDFLNYISYSNLYFQLLTDYYWSDNTSNLICS